MLFAASCDRAGDETGDELFIKNTFLDIRKVEENGQSRIDALILVKNINDDIAIRQIRHIIFAMDSATNSIAGTDTVRIDTLWPGDTITVFHSVDIPDTARHYGFAFQYWFIRSDWFPFNHP